MKVVILAGGLGTRLAEETRLIPKPMVEIGGRPILWHIMNGYAQHGFDEFVVALGYRAEVVKDYFLRYRELRSDLSIDLGTGEVALARSETVPWKVHLVDTGPSTQTGGRLRRLRRLLGDETFMATYGDGLGNVDIGALVDFHRQHGKLATVTAVRPPSRFGSLRIQGDRVAAFKEKPHAGEGWINGGFFVLEPTVLDMIEGDATPFEEAPLEDLAISRQLMAYKHEGFWHPMDTLRDKQVLEEMWASGRAPWKTETKCLTLLPAA